VINLYKLSTVAAPAEARAVLSRALSIADSLARAGKLTAEQREWPKLLRARLAKLSPP